MTKYKNLNLFNKTTSGNISARRGIDSGLHHNKHVLVKSNHIDRETWLSPEDALALAEDIRSAAQEILAERPQYAVRRDDFTVSTYKYQVFNHRKANNPIGIFESVAIAEQYAHRLNNET